MKLNQLIVLAILFMFIPLNKAAAQSNASLTVTITGLRNNTGQVGATLFNKAEGFPSAPNAAYKHGSKLPVNKTVSITFENLTAGYFAVGMLHDENNNKEMDYNFFGIPTEGFGISNNPKMTFRAPNFDEAKFYVKPGTNAITIKAKYM